jgi:hypothetical protein
MKSLLLAIAIIPLLAFAQDEEEPEVLLYGIMVTEADTVPIRRSELQISINGQNPVKVVVVNDSGYYSLGLDYDVHYRIQYKARGFASKCIVVDTHNVEQEKRPGGFGLNVDVRLIKPKRKSYFEFLESECVGRTTYDPEEENFIWDPTITELMNVKIEKAKELDLAGKK